MNMYTDGHDEDGQYTKEEYAVHQNGDPAGAHVAELDHPRPRRELKQEPRRQENEEYHRNDHRAPISRHPPSISCLETCC